MKQPGPLGLRAILVALLLAPGLRAEVRPPPVAVPREVSAPSRVLALRFAAHDVELWTRQIDPRTKAAEGAAPTAEVANKAIAEAKAAQQAAEKSLAEAKATVAAGEAAKSAADKTLAAIQETLKKIEANTQPEAAAREAATAAVALALKSVEAATAALEVDARQNQQAETAKKEADGRLKQVEQAGKPALDAKAAADKALAEAQAQFKLHQARRAAFEAAEPRVDVAGTRLIQTLTHDRPLHACRFDLGGDCLFAGAQDHCFHRVDLFANSAEHPTAHTSWIASLAVVPPDGATVLAGGHDGKLTWWNCRDRELAPIRKIDAHAGAIRSIAVSPDGALVATAGNDNLVKVWGIADGQLVKELAGHTRHVYNVAFHPSGNQLVSGDLLGVIRQWEVGSWNMVRELDAKVLWKYDPTFKADVGGVRAFAFSPDGKYLAAGGITDVSNAFAGVGNPCVVLYDFETGKQLKILRPKEDAQGSIFGVRFSPTGDFVVAVGGGATGGMWFWTLDDDKSTHFVKLPSVAYDLDYHPDGLRLAVALFNKTLCIYDLSALPAAGEPPG